MQALAGDDECTKTVRDSIDSEIQATYGLSEEDIKGGPKERRSKRPSKVPRWMVLYEQKIEKSVNK